MRLRAGDRVLIRLPGWLGDAVMAEPAVSAIAAAVGPRNVTLAGSPATCELLARGLEGARTEPARPGPSWPGCDVAVLLTGSFRSALDAFRAGIPVRAGWARDGRGWLLTHAARPPREVGRTPPGLGRPGRWPRILPRPFGTACNELAAWLGVSVRRTRPRLVLAPDDRRRLARRLEAAGLREHDLGAYVLASVGARTGSAKGYPAGSWARVINELTAGGRRVVLAVGPGEESAMEAVRAGLDPHPGALCLIDPPADLGELCAWIAGADRVLTADSGPRHLAVAFDRPVVVATGPTDPRHTADHLDRTELVRVPVPCGPCHLERCPNAGAEHHQCMTRIAPETLVRLVLER